MRRENISESGDAGRWTMKLKALSSVGLVDDGGQCRRSHLNSELK